MKARKPPLPHAWSVPRAWEGETAVCIGGGPSLTPVQVDYVRGKARVVAVNDAYLLAPWADALYACDHKWWKWHERGHVSAAGKIDGPASQGFAGEKVTHSQHAAAEWPELKWLTCQKKAPGLSRDPAKLHCGRNSGYQAINLAYLYGARRIVLIGYDLRLVDNRAHWFGEHPNKVPSNYKGWLENYRTIAAQLPAIGLDIINCTPGSALKCFPMRRLEEVL